jgi:hypothetical protein
VGQNDVPRAETVLLRKPLLARSLTVFWPVSPGADLLTHCQRIATVQIR